MYDRSVNHLLPGKSISFVIEKTCERLGKLIRDLIKMMNDRIYSNGVAQKDLASDEDNLMAIPCFYHALDKISKKFDDA